MEVTNRVTNTLINKIAKLKKIWYEGGPTLAKQHQSQQRHKKDIEKVKSKDRRKQQKDIYIGRGEIP